MKIRTGFVSNSSSSSFIIAVNGNLKKELQQLLKLYQGKSKDLFLPIGDIAKDIIDVIIENSQEHTFDSYEEETGFTEKDLENDYSDIYKKVKNDGWKFYAAEVATDDDNPIEQYLCSKPFDFKNQDIIIHKEKF